MSWLKAEVGFINIIIMMILLVYVGRDTLSFILMLSSDVIGVQGCHTRVMIGDWSSRSEKRRHVIHHPPHPQPTPPRSLGRDVIRVRMEMRNIGFAFLRVEKKKWEKKESGWIIGTASI